MSVEGTPRSCSSAADGRQRFVTRGRRSVDNAALRASGGDGLLELESDLIASMVLPVFDGLIER